MVVNSQLYDAGNSSTSTIEPLTMHFHEFSLKRRVSCLILVFCHASAPPKINVTSAMWMKVWNVKI